MLEDCFRYYRGCQKYHTFGDIQRDLASAMNPIVKLWPFRGWGINFVRDRSSGTRKEATSKENEVELLIGFLCNPTRTPTL
jgi:hypothetical protein